MSQNIVYTTIQQAVIACSTLEEQISLINTICINMLMAINDAGSSGGEIEYKLDTGQTKIERTYSNVNELQKAYDSMRLAQKMLLADLNNQRYGRVTRLVDGKNFITRPGHPFNSTWNF